MAGQYNPLAQLGMQGAFGNAYASAYVSRRELKEGDLVLSTATREKRVVRTVMFASRYVDGQPEYALVGWKGLWGRVRSEWVDVSYLHPIVTGENMSDEHKPAPTHPEPTEPTKPQPVPQPDDANPPGHPGGG